MDVLDVRKPFRLKRTMTLYQCRTIVLCGGHTMYYFRVTAMGSSTQVSTESDGVAQHAPQRIATTKACTEAVACRAQLALRCDLRSQTELEVSNLRRLRGLGCVRRAAAPAQSCRSTWRYRLHSIAKSKMMANRLFTRSGSSNALCSPLVVVPAAVHLFVRLPVACVVAFQNGWSIVLIQSAKWCLLGR